MRHCRYITRRAERLQKSGRNCQFTCTNTRFVEPSAGNWFRRTQSNARARNTHVHVRRRINRSTGLLELRLKARPGRRCRCKNFAGSSADTAGGLQGWGTYRQIKTGAGFKLKNKNVPFSAVSGPNFASKNSSESSRRDLHNALLCTVL